MARRVRALMHTHGALARFARARPGLLARQQLGEAMRRVTVRRDALVALALMAGCAVTPSKRTREPACPGLGHPIVAALQLLPSEVIQIVAQATASAGQNAPRDALGGSALRG